MSISPFHQSVFACYVLNTGIFPHKNFITLILLSLLNSRFTNTTLYLTLFPFLFNTLTHI